MSWLDEILDHLATKAPCGYAPDGPSMSEPTAVAALALSQANRADAAVPGLNWLKKIQAADGSVGISEAETTPNWPTSWAILAWVAADRQRNTTEFHSSVKQAAQWLVTLEGQRMQAVTDVGHDESLKGWPWVAGTHSWIEPTVFAALGLRAAGMADHPRALEAVRLLYDRQLPHGGCNYGNTIVLGQELLPHIQPTGLVMLALAGEKDPKRHIDRGLIFLKKSLGFETATASLCYGLLGLTAHNQRPDEADEWLQAAAKRTLSGDKSPYKLALLVLAAKATLDRPLLPAAKSNN